MQTVQVDQSGASRTLKAIQQVDGAGTVRVLKQLWMVGPDGVSRQIFSSAPPVSASPTFVSGSGYGKTPITISTRATTVTAPSGSTFSWSSPDSGWSAINPTSATTGFRKTGVISGVDATTVFTCVVTLPGAGTTSVSVTAEVSNNYDA